MATDEMIWADIGHISCTLEDDNGKEILRCNHYAGTLGDGGCSARKEERYVHPNEPPCGNSPRILVSKQEYVVWRLTK